MSAAAAPALAGSDGFLFESGTDLAPLGAGDLLRWTTTLESRHGWCGLQDAAYFVLVVPDRAVVNADRLPPDHAAPAERPLAQIRAALAEPVRAGLLYPDDALRAGRAAAETFFRTDRGLSRHGAYLAYRALAEAAARHVPMEPIGESELAPGQRRSFVGDLGAGLAQAGVDEFAEITTNRAGAARRVLGEGALHEGQAQVFAGGTGDLPGLVVFGDADATHIMDPFLLAHFSRAVLMGGGQHFLPDLVRAERPQLVVSVIAERHLGDADWFLNDLSRVHFAGLTGLSLPLPSFEPAESRT